MGKLVKKPKYMGITLIFSNGEDGKLWVENPSFVIKFHENLNEMVKVVKKIKDKYIFGSPNTKFPFYSYMGIKDLFSICGPLKHGAMMGQTSKWSYNNVEKSKVILARHHPFQPLKSLETAIDGMYLVELIYFLGSPIPYKSRRSLVVLGIVQSPQKKNIILKAKELGDSLEFKKKIVLKDYELRISSDHLQFVGANIIRPLDEKLRVGNYFDIRVREIKSLSQIKKVKIPTKKTLSRFFQQIDDWY